MRHTIELSDESVSLLKQQASDHGVTLEAWIEELARRVTRFEGPANRQKAQTAAARILEIQKRVRPDPEGWTIRNYIDHGRR